MALNSALEVSNLSVSDVLELLSTVLGSKATDALLKKSQDEQTLVKVTTELRQSILDNRENLVQLRIDIQQLRIESQNTRLDLADFRKESSDLFGSFETRIDELMSTNEQRDKSLIDSIREACEAQMNPSRKRKLSATEEELLSLTDPHYVPTEDNIFSEDEDLDLGEEESSGVNEAQQQEIDHDAPYDWSQLDTSKAPYYKMVRGLDSIKMIWDEYVTGINGGPPVRELERQFIGKWKDDTERKYFSYRKKLYVIIEKIMRLDNKTAEEAIDYLERFLSAQGTRKSMTWLYDNIDERFRP